MMITLDMTLEIILCSRAEWVYRWCREQCLHGWSRYYWDVYTCQVNIMQSHTFYTHIFDTSLEYYIEHSKNMLHDEELKLENIIPTECVLEKITKPRRLRLKKVGYIEKGIPSSTESCWSLLCPQNKLFVCCQYVDWYMRTLTGCDP